MSNQTTLVGRFEFLTIPAACRTRLASIPQVGEGLLHFLLAGLDVTPDVAFRLMAGRLHRGLDALFASDLAKLRVPKEVGMDVDLLCFRKP